MLAGPSRRSVDAGMHETRYPEGHVATDGNKQLIQRITEEVVNRGDYSIVRELFSSQYTIHKAGMSFPPGPEAYKMAVREWREAFPDYRVTITELIADGDFVACLFVAEGTHTGGLRGMPPTEKSFKIVGTDVHRIVDGQLVESWLADDLPRILTDTGVMAPTNTNSSQWT
jgi:predicted ester cyclase